MLLEKLEGQKGILRLLVFVYDNGESNFQKIVDEGNLYDRVVRSSVAVLKEINLLTTRVDDSSYPRKNMVSLTERGETIAKKLKEIEKVLGEID